MYLLTPPSAEPVTLAEAKLSARLDGPEWDDLITGYIAAARQVAEQETGARFIAQTQRAEFTDWPGVTDTIPVSRPTAVAVSYWSGLAWVGLTDGTHYAWAAVDGGFVIAPPLNGTLPTLGEIAIGPRVRIDATSGEATAATVPQCVKMFIGALVTLMVHDPALTASDAATPLLRGLLNPVRTYL